MRLLLLLLLSSACASPGQRYVGTLTPDVPSPTCRPSRASLVLRDGAAVFTPDEGTWTLTGPTSGRTLTADRASRGADRTPYTTRVQAQWDGTTATGTYTTPRCTFRLAAEVR